jgi:hypothetical protein
MEFVHIYGFDSFQKVREHTCSFPGGHYPLGTYNFWHTGLHIWGGSRIQPTGIKKNGPVKPIAKGKIRAFRLTKKELDVNVLFEKFYNGKYPDSLPYEDVNCFAEETTKKFHYDHFDNRASGYTKTPLFMLPNQNWEITKKFICNVSNNFVLLEHEVPWLKKNLPGGPVKYYSLYMHLKAYDELSPAEKAAITIGPSSVWNDSNPFDTTSISVIPPDQPQNNGQRDKDVGAMDILGYPGYTPLQSNICHIEVFTPDERILDLTKLVDPNEVVFTKRAEPYLEWEGFLKEEQGITVISKDDALGKQISMDGSSRIQMFDIERIRYDDDLCNLLSRRIIYTKSQWDEDNLDEYMEMGYRYFSGKEKEKKKSCLIPQMVFDKENRVGSLLGDFNTARKFYYFHPGAFVNNFLEIYNTIVQGKGLIKFTSTYLMGDAPWGSDFVGNAAPTKNEDQYRMKNVGCLVTGLANMISTFNECDITPAVINNKKYFPSKGTDNDKSNIDTLRVIEDYGLTREQCYKDKTGCNIKSKIESIKNDLIVGHMVIAWVYYSDRDLNAKHFVGVNDIDPTGNYIDIAPTSEQDRNESNRKSSWKINNKVYVPFENIERIDIYFKKVKEK